MSEKTAIQWTDATFNAWWGCSKVSPGCDHCYAEAFDKRLGGKHWGPGAPRKTFGDAHWAEPLKWNKRAERDGLRRKVFCSSMADVFDAEAPPGELDRLWALIRETPMLDWQLLTKRIERAETCLPSDWGRGYPNVWLGATIENQEMADRRVPRLLAVPAAVHFASCEPLLGPVDLWRVFTGHLPPMIDWVIVGGESGHGARPFDVAWARDLIVRCRRHDASCFVKQLGADVRDRNDAGFEGVEDDEWPFEGEVDCIEENLSGYRDGYQGAPVRVRLRDRKGGDMDEWPRDLRVRTFPRSNNALIHEERLRRTGGG